MHEQIDLGAQDALVPFVLSDGRRREPLNDHQVASAVSAARTNLAVERAVLAQHLSAVSDSEVVSDFFLACFRGLGNGGMMPGFGRRMVGFQPQITVLPATTMASISQAVVSADRRYVRMSPTPFFSTIGDVKTFNFAGAADNDLNP